MPERERVPDHGGDGVVDARDKRAMAEVELVAGNIERYRALLAEAAEDEARDQERARESFEDLEALKVLLDAEDAEVKQEWAKTAQEIAGSMEIHDDVPKNALSPDEDETLLGSARRWTRQAGAYENRAAAWTGKQALKAAPGTFAGYKILRFTGRAVTMPFRVAWDAFKWIGGMVDERVNSWSEEEFKPLKWMNKGIDAVDEKLEELNENNLKRWRGEEVDKKKK